MRKSSIKDRMLISAVTGMLLFLLAAHAQAVVDGIPGNEFTLTAKADHIDTPDGNIVYIWGYANGANRGQLPGPTLIVQEGALVTVRLTNELPASAGRVSIVFPGQEVTATGGSVGLLTRESGGPADEVQYQFTATHPGTYLYHSGTSPELQIEMGLYGALIVRPDMGPNYAYNDEATRFDREFLFLLSEMDPGIHQMVELGLSQHINNTSWWPVYWFINGRCAPDTMRPAFWHLLPTQPYNCMPLIEPGERMLMRVVNAGRDLHPFHHHGNHARIIAKDGRLLSSGAGAGPDLAEVNFTIQAVPGETADAIFEWTGKGLGWDIYGTESDGQPHNCIDLVDNNTGLELPAGPQNPYAPGDGFADMTSDRPWEWCPDHGKPMPVFLPNKLDLTFGIHYSGSPFLGVKGILPPAQGGFNRNAGLFFMWHSHTEKEMVNFDIFPGGMMTMFVVEPPGTAMP